MKHLHRFFSSDASGGIILIIAAILAMMMANSGATSGWYHDFLETPVQLRVGSLEINKNMLLWINDALMAVFFLLVGLEVKRETDARIASQLTPGRISSYRRYWWDDCAGITLSGF
ncbi:Na(+)/H(+) antiporter 1 [Escherichia coli]|uniref:Na(+)/H(+) antiporter 1 n=1 Tax=Escherichia coli TaxID=562 RepID=A0A377DZ49_ECOLX|nr:Na(+)/H(+) antiporter 1 [Escherichia coli]